jgi:hypothetical protein
LNNKLVIHRGSTFRAKGPLTVSKDAVLYIGRGEEGADPIPTPVVDKVKPRECPDTFEFEMSKVDMTGMEFKGSCSGSYVPNYFQEAQRNWLESPQTDKGPTATQTEHSHT